MFAIFIIGCGFTHFMGFLEFFVPWFWLGATINCVTAIASVATILYIIPVVPNIMQLRSQKELTNLNDELAETKEKLYQLNKALQVRLSASEAFSRTVAHDLNAPLRTIDGFTEILLQDYSDCLDEKAKDYVNRLRNAALKMAQLLKDMQRLSVITHGEMELKIRKISLTNMFKTIINEANMMNPTRKVEVKIQENMIADADPEILALAINNLISNAYKYTRKNAIATIEIGCDKLNNENVYYIKDNGVGFDPSKTTELFQPFKRLHATEFEGSGIGLTIVKRVIELHHGKVWATGQVNRGATFFFTIGT
jgi:signal transduction histidine kinase